MAVNVEVALKLALKKHGWELVNWAEVKGDGILAPGAVVAINSHTKSYHPFVAYFFNASDGSFYFGDYCRTADELAGAFGTKCARYKVEPKL